MTVPSTSARPGNTEAAETAAGVVVGLGELEVIAGLRGILVTYALGSCLGITMYDPVARLGGLAHLQLPSSRSAISPASAQNQAGRYVDLGMTALLSRMTAGGGDVKRLRIALAGGAVAPKGTKDFFSIGERNLTAARKWLWTSRLLVHGEDVGGTNPRSMSLDMSTGKTSIICQGSTYFI